MVYYVHITGTPRKVNTPVCDGNLGNFDIDIFGFKGFFYFYFGTYLEDNLV